MLRFYHLDVWADLGSARLTWRRLGVLLRHLPRESAYARSVHGEDARWGDAEHLLATIADRVQVGNIQRRAAHFKGKPPKFEPIQRPGGAAAKPRAVSPAEAFRRMRG